MAENLNYEAEGSRCYGEVNPVLDSSQRFITLSKAEIQANCTKYGRLYNWETAMKSCPSGWHLPSKAEWGILMTVVGGNAIAGKCLKAVSGWVSRSNYNGNGEDKYGFSALPSGSISISINNIKDSLTYFVGFFGWWWSTNENTTDLACTLTMSFNDDIARYRDDSKNTLYSVRCLQNATPPKGETK